MVFFNHATRQMTAKIVYYGPGLCGKTTNLNTIYGKTSQKARGEMVSLNTETDRTLFFDLLPMDVGMVGGFKTKLQLYTVPGQVFYNSTRKLVLKGVDGVVFVVDSQTPMLEACKESYLNLEENLRELGLNLGDIPTVFQWNKRDLRNVISVDELEAVFNPKGAPSFQSVASDGSGVFETLRGITKLALSHIKVHVLGETHSVAAPVPGPPPTEVEALTLSDLPSVTDLLDMEGTAPPDYAVGATPLADDDDDSGLFIEAPVLPEPPEAGEDDIAFLLEDEDMLPPAGPQTEELLASAMTGFDRAFELESPSAQPEALPASFVGIQAEATSTSGDIPVPVPEIEGAPEPERTALETPVVWAAGPEGESLPGAPGMELAPAAEPVPSASAVDEVPRPSKSAHRVDPLAALASLKVEPRRPVAKSKPIDHSDAINSLLGELTQAGRSGLPSVLRLEVPPDLDGSEIEVVVQVRRQGQVLVEGTIHRPLPGKGSTSKLSVEFKRS
jgi:signal recognition particle receptor subunit beta